MRVKLTSNSEEKKRNRLLPGKNRRFSAFSCSERLRLELFYQEKVWGGLRRARETICRKRHKLDRTWNEECFNDNDKTRKNCHPNNASAGRRLGQVPACAWQKAVAIDSSSAEAIHGDKAECEGGGGTAMLMSSTIILKQSGFMCPCW